MEPNASWYYADANRQKHGPLPREAIVAAFDRGELNDATLLWRPGLERWQPLSTLRGELGIAKRIAPQPPPLDPPAMTASTPAFASASDDIVYAGFVKRWAALIIDNLILCIPATILSVAAMAALLPAHPSNELVAGVEVIFYLIWFGVAALYYAGMESSRHQATFGKRAIGIKVTDLDGGRLSFTRALGRWFAAALSYLTVYVGFFMAGFTARKQALHDLVAGTLVVDRWAWTDHPERQQRNLGAGAIVLVVIPLAIIPILGILAAIAIPAYQDYVMRSKVAGALVQASMLKTQIAEVFLESQHCPRNGDDGFGTPESYAGANVAGIEVLQRDTGACGIDITLRAPGQRALDGRKIQLTGQPTNHGLQWECRADVERRHLGSSCAPYSLGTGSVSR